MTDTIAAIDTYVATYNETEPAARAKLVAAAWAENGRHVDPLDDVEGHAAIDAYLAGVQDHYPGHRVERTTEIDGHHELFRFGWRFVAPDGSIVVTATDSGQLASDGRVQRVDCFFGDLSVRDA